LHSQVESRNTLTPIYVHIYGNGKRAGDRGFEPRSGQTKDYGIGI
jgi:hypothetical protein